MGINEILTKIIKDLYDVEHCGGDWSPECEDIASERCITCCQGHKLLEELKKEIEVKP